jgi:hypothetical protein
MSHTFKLLLVYAGMICIIALIYATGGLTWSVR